LGVVEGEQTTAKTEAGPSPLAKDDNVALVGWIRWLVGGGDDGLLCWLI
jgi:hypothetical protein